MINLRGACLGRRVNVLLLAKRGAYQRLQDGGFPGIWKATLVVRSLTRRPSHPPIDTANTHSKFQRTIILFYRRSQVLVVRINNQRARALHFYRIE